MLARATRIHRLPIPVAEELPKPVSKGDKRQPDTDPGDDEVFCAHLRAQANVFSVLVGFVGCDARSNGAY